MAHFQSASEPTETVSTTVKFSVAQTGKGQYVVQQLQPEQTFSIASANRRTFNFDVKMMSVSGYIDIDDKEFEVKPSIFGVEIGDGWKAGFNSGLQIQLVLALYNGSVRFFVEGSTLKFHLHLKPLLPWGDEVNESGDVTTF